MLFTLLYDIIILIKYINAVTVFLTEKYISFIKKIHIGWTHHFLQQNDKRKNNVFMPMD